MNSLFYSALILLLLLILSRQAFMKKRYELPLHLLSSFQPYSQEHFLPSLSAIETAFFLRDRRTVIVTAIMEHFLNGVIRIEQLSPLRIKVNADDNREKAPFTSLFLQSIEDDGSICAIRLEKALDSICDGLMKKIWLSDKTMLRSYLEDRIELVYENLLEKGAIQTDEELLWLFLHTDIQEEGLTIPPLKDGRILATCAPLMPDNSLHRLFRRLSLEIFFQETEKGNEEELPAP